MAAQASCHLSHDALAERVKEWFSRAAIIIGGLIILFFSAPLVGDVIGLDMDLFGEWFLAFFNLCIGLPMLVWVVIGVKRKPTYLPGGMVGG
ncbi:hypothetical protein JXA12_05570 [Candidatus Woesearchaeota archaeon]|nr:hypothetical protein [Candidatus Woesearchaeota archaeon]